MKRRDLPGAKPATRRAMLTLIGGLVAGAMAGRPAWASDVATALAFLDALYAHYIGPEGTAYGAPWGSEAGIGLYFAPEAANLILADRNGAEARMEAPVLNGDPFVDSQEWIIDGFDIDIAPIEDAAPPRTQAVVRFVNHRRAVVVRLDLVHLDDGWRIADIAWDDRMTLRRLLSEPI